MTTRPTLPARISEVDAQTVLGGLDELAAHVRALLSLADSKLAGLRAADTQALASVARQEVRELELLFAARRRQDAILARLAQDAPASAARAVRAAEIAARCGEPLASRILSKSSGLRDATRALQEKNRRAADVARHLQLHIRAIFSEIAEVGRECIAYDPAGRKTGPVTQHWVDAVG